MSRPRDHPNRLTSEALDVFVRQLRNRTQEDVEAIARLAIEELRRRGSTFPEGSP